MKVPVFIFALAIVVTSIAVVVGILFIAKAFPESFVSIAVCGLFALMLYGLTMELDDELDDDEDGP